MGTSSSSGPSCESEDAKSAEAQVQMKSGEACPASGETLTRANAAVIDLASEDI